MPWTNITKPTVGSAIRKWLADKIIDNLNFLFGLFSSAQSSNIANGSFEIDGDADGIPDEWDRTLFTGGSFTLDTSAGNFIHGAKASKFVHPGGGGNGGGYLTSKDFFDWSEQTPLLLEWSHKCSVAGMLDKVDVLFYDSAKALISTVNVYSSTANPTSWTMQRGLAHPPATTRYAKIRITGGDSSNTTGGSSWWDNVSIVQFTRQFEQEVIFGTPGTFAWRAPTNCKLANVQVIGGGGGGAGGGSNGGGGGAGGYSQIWFVPTPGSDYAIVVGIAGTAGANPNGAGGNGGQSSFNATVLANGGTGSTSSSGGAGGSASGGDTNVAGGAGSNRVSSAGDIDGGVNPQVGVVATINNGVAPYYGAGGAGAGGVVTTGSIGGVGAVIIRWRV